MELNNNEVFIIVEHMYNSLSKVTNNFTSTELYKNDIELYKKLKNSVG